MKIGNLLRNTKFLTGVGIISVVSGAVATGIGTYLTIKDIEKARPKLEEIKNKAVEDTQNGATDKETTKQLGIETLKLGGKIALNYSVAAGLVVGGILGITRSYYILSKTNAALTATCAGLQATLDKVRQNIIDKEGEDKWLEYRYGIKKEEITTTNEKGKEIKVEQLVADENAVQNPQTIWFNEDCVEFDRNYSTDYNKMFLQQVQSILNSQLPGMKIILLNDFFDAIGHPRTEEGSVVGWDYENGDGYIDLRPTPVTKVDPSTGRNVIVYLLDPNTDGVVINKYDKLIG